MNVMDALFKRTQCQRQLSTAIFNGISVDCGRRRAMDLEMFFARINLFRCCLHKSIQNTLRVDARSQHSTKTPTKPRWWQKIPDHQRIINNNWLEWSSIATGRSSPPDNIKCRYSKWTTLKKRNPFQFNNHRLPFRRVQHISVSDEIWPWNINRRWIKKQNIYIFMDHSARILNFATSMHNRPPLLTLEI